MFSFNEYIKSIQNNAIENLILSVLLMELFIFSIWIVSISAILYYKFEIIRIIFESLQPYSLVGQNITNNLTALQITDFLLSSKINIANIVVFFGFLGIFIYFFALIKTHGMFLLETEKEGNKFLLIFENVYFLILGIIIYIISLAFTGILLTVSNVQIILISLQLILLILISILFKYSFPIIIHDYNKIRKFNRYLLHLSENYKFIGYFPEKFFKNNNPISGVLLLLLIVFPVYGILFNYNIIIIIFIECAYLYLHILLSSAYAIPRSVQKIRLTSNEIIICYILYESLKGYILALTKENERIRIMQHDIRGIYL